MLVKYKTAALFMVIVLACASTALAVPAQINKLELIRDGSFTVLIIGGDSQLKFAHQSIDAKEGKAFRIVIDCLAARHNLRQKDFEDLPRSIIKSIRTSQYAVSPELVVRVVLDLNEESVYRVEAEGNYIKVYVSDQKTAPFGQWSSHPAKTGTSPLVQKPSPVNPNLKTSPAPLPESKTTVVTTSVQPQPAVASTAKKPSVVKQREQQSSQTAPSVPYVVKAPVLTKNDKFGPVVAKADNKQQSQPVAVQDNKPETKSTAVKPTPTVAPKTEKAESQTKMASQPPVQGQPEIKKDLVGDTTARAKAFAAADPKPAPVPEPGMNTKQPKSEQKDVRREAPAPSAKAEANEPKSNVTKPETSKPAPSVPSPVAEDKRPVLASVDKADQKPTAPGLDADDDNIDKIKTSRYRRESAKSAELKASQVVQFPQRMVIKYNQGNSRDPFASLISPDKKKKGNVDLKSVPNVETLNLVGILEPESGKGAALMEDLDGIGYILRPGDRVRNGYVAQVDKNAIYFQINEYGWGRTIVKHMEKEN